MGTRYFLTVVCPECGTEEKDVYYAPTCDFVSRTCSRCGTEIDLEKYTGITYEDASNLAEIEAIIAAMLTPKEAEYLSKRMGVA